MTLQNLRFWFSIPLLLKECFCAIGWNFVCDHFENGDHEHLYAYLSAENWHWYTDKTDLRWVHLNIASPRSQPANVDFTLFDEVYDPNDLYNNIFALDRYRYGGAPIDVIVEIRFQIRNLSVTLPAPPAGESAYTFVFGIRKIDGATVKYVHSETVTGSSDETITRVLNFDYIDKDANGDDSYDFFMWYQNLQTENYSTYTLNGGDVYIRPDQSHYTTGDVIPLADLLSNEITCLDLFHACTHLINGKIVTDNASRTVFLYPPYSYTKADGSDQIEGFYKRNKGPIDLRPNTAGQSWEIETRDRERYLIFGFNDNTDEYLTSDSLFTRRVDIGAGLPKEKKYLNPLFQATGEVQAEAADVGGSGGIYMPALWDNSEGLLSNELKPRLAIFYGDIDQGGLTWSFEGSPRATVPYLAQVAGIELPGGVQFIPVTWAGYVDDLYQKFYSREIENPSNDLLYKLIITGGDPVFKAIDFRRTILIQGKDSNLELQPLSIKDHPAGSRVPLLLEARMI